MQNGISSISWLASHSSNGSGNEPATQTVLLQVHDSADRILVDLITEFTAVTLWFKSKGTKYNFLFCFSNQAPWRLCEPFHLSSLYFQSTDIKFSKKFSKLREVKTIKQTNDFLKQKHWGWISSKALGYSPPLFYQIIFFFSSIYIQNVINGSLSSSAVCSWGLWTVLKPPIAHFEDLKELLTIKFRTSSSDNSHFSKNGSLTTPTPAILYYSPSQPGEVREEGVSFNVFSQARSEYWVGKRERFVSWRPHPLSISNPTDLGSSHRKKIGGALKWTPSTVFFQGRALNSGRPWSTLIKCYTPGLWLSF